MGDLAAIVAFMEARLDEDDAWANAMHHAIGESETYSCPATRTGPLGDLEWGEENCDCGLAERKGRALREVAAKRAILRRCVPWMNEPDQYPNGLVSPRALMARQNLMDLATVWSDSPEYQEGWKP